MEEVVSPTDSADSTPVTVEHSLLCRLVIVQRASGAVVQSEVLAACLTRLAFRLLDAASQALDVGHRVPVQLVILLWVEACIVPDLIVTEPAGVVCSLADWVWASELTLAQVVLAPIVLLISSIVVRHVLDLFLLALSSFAAVLMSRPWYLRLLLNLSLECRCLRLWVDRSLRLFLLRLGVPSLALFLLIALR